jgi:hypothetical protein
MAIVVKSTFVKLSMLCSKFCSECFLRNKKDVWMQWRDAKYAYMVRFACKNDCNVFAEFLLTVGAVRAVQPVAGLEWLLFCVIKTV